MIAILDYCAGNIRSLINALEQVKARTVLTLDPEVINQCTHLIIPGVGSFGFASDYLMKNNLFPTIHEFNKNKKPILGICLGYHLLQQIGFEDGEHPGLGLLPGTVNRLSEQCRPLPHIGWNDLIIPKSMVQHPLFNNIKNHQFYFAHSYYVGYTNEIPTCAHTRYQDFLFTSLIINDNIIGVQFHPEKSHHQGLTLLENFTKM